MPHIDVFYSFRSPYCYLAIGQLAQWAAEDGIGIAIRPVLPLAVKSPTFFEQMNPLGPPYVQMDTKRVADYLGVPFRWPNPDPVVMTMNPLSIPKEQPYIHRLTRLGIEAGRQDSSLGFTHAVGRLLWSGAIDDWTADDHLHEAIASAGLDLDEMEARIDANPQEYERSLEANHQAHADAGHWGAPCMVFEGEPFFGQDRIPVLKWRVSQRIP